MKKITQVSILLLGVFTLLLTAAFKIKDNSEIIIDKFGNAAACSPNLLKSSNGTKVAYTQSAHDQTTPGTCAGCHSGGTATPVATITASPAFGAGNTYVPGSTYTISYQVTGYTKYGFDLEMNDGNTTTSMTAGTLSALSNTRYTAAPAGGYPANISQLNSIPTATAATFKWIAPSVGTTVYLFSNALGVNGTGSTSGDKEAFKNIILTPASTAILTLTCPANQTINSSVSTTVPNVTLAATATTTCAGGLVTKTQSPAVGTPLTVGNNVITVTATDNCGNTQTCTSTINYVINTGVLTLACPANQTISSSTSTTVPDLTTSATATTTCPGGTVTKTQSPLVGTALVAGNNVITIVATDNCGNAQTCTSTINYVINTGVLTLACPANQTISSSTSTTVTDLTTSTTATTTCPGGMVTKTQNPAAGTALITGNNVITITATDNCGNTQTCNSTINYVINTGILTLACPANQTISSSTSTTVPDLTISSTATTTCSGGVVTKTQSPVSGTALIVGNNLITITATDNCGNIQTCTSTINYISSLGILNLTCPGNQTITSSTQTFVPNLIPTSTSNSSCGSSSVVTVTQSPVFGSPLNVGSNIVTITASDICGNSQTCTSTINYTINSSTLTLSCGSSQTILSTTQTTVPDLLTSTTATTTCSGGTVTKTQSPASGSPLSVGNNVITITATDNCGNTQTCVTTVNYVINTGVITLNCPSNQSINASQQTTLPNFASTTTASSTCIGGITTITQSPAAGTAMTSGINTIIITATDVCSTTQTCQVTVNYTNDLGIESINSLNKLEMYPNPSQGELTIEYAVNSESKILVQISDMNGKIISTLIDATSIEGSYASKINLEGINKGIYFVNFTINGNIVHKKLMVD